MWRQQKQSMTEYGQSDSYVALCFSGATNIHLVKMLMISASFSKHFFKIIS